jgi:hypothetical protein
VQHSDEHSVTIRVHAVSGGAKNEFFRYNKKDVIQTQANSCGRASESAFNRIVPGG